MLPIILLSIVTTLFAGWRAWRRLRHFLHRFQLLGYRTPALRSWVLTRMGTVVFRLSHKLALAELALAIPAMLFLSPSGTAAVILPLWAITFASSRLYRSTADKKPLCHTPRMKRLIATAGTVASIPTVAGLLLWLGGHPSSVVGYLGGLFITDLLAPVWVLLSAWLMQPVESLIQDGFKRRARQRLRDRPDLKIVAVTGSYGKTSTKRVMDTLLSLRYHTLVTPSSYNTPMGLCIVINEMLREEHQVLVLEMGIRHPGDMDELCAIARPDIGVETSIGVAHLESMGSVDRIAQEKARMLEAMPEDGIAVLNIDDERIAAMSDLVRGRVWRVSAEGRPGADLTASGIRYDHQGTSFQVRDHGGRTLDFRTKLLGEHNVTNILLALATGCAMGLHLRQMVHAVERLEPIEHRLQLRSEGPITIIDDAFNANPVGARNAVNILGQFRMGRRVIVTPGMIELGDQQWEANRTLGEHIAKHVDLAVLVGARQTAPIQEGLRTRRFPEEQVKIVDSLWEAQAFLQSWLQEGDVVLYENDLPDQYDA